MEDKVSAREDQAERDGGRSFQEDKTGASEGVSDGFGAPIMGFPEEYSSAVLENRGHVPSEGYVDEVLECNLGRCLCHKLYQRGKQCPWLRVLAEALW